MQIQWFDKMLDMFRVVRTDASGAIDAQITPRHETTAQLMNVADGGEGEIASSSDGPDLVMFRGTPTDTHIRLSSSYSSPLMTATPAFQFANKDVWTSLGLNGALIAAGDPYGQLAADPVGTTIGFPPWIDITRPSLIRISFQQRMSTYVELAKLELKLVSLLDIPLNAFIDPHMVLTPPGPSSIEDCPMDSWDCHVLANQIPPAPNDRFSIQVKPTMVNAETSVLFYAMLTIDFYQAPG